MDRYILDTSAILTLLKDEAGIETVLELLQAAGARQVGLYIPFIALMELEYINLRRSTRDETEQMLSLVRAWPVSVAHSTEKWCHEAARVKATTALSVADAWICSLAGLLDAKLVHKDPEYDAVFGLNALRLPYK